MARKQARKEIKNAIAEAENKAENQIEKCKKRKRLMSDVQMAITMAANKLKTSPQLQKELGLSESQYNKRLKLIKQGPCRRVRVVVRCDDCSSFLYVFDKIILPKFDKQCDCDRPDEC